MKKLDIFFTLLVLFTLLSIRPLLGNLKTLCIQAAVAQVGTLVKPGPLQSKRYR